MELILKLLLAHVIGDFLFQPDKWVKDKERNKVKSPFLYWHILIHLTSTAIILQFNYIFWIGFVTIIFSHYIIDLTKLHLLGKLDKTLLFIIDQILHVSVITGVSYSYSPFVIKINKIFSQEVVLFAFALILVTVVFSTIIKMIMSRWNIYNSTPKSTLENAGSIIGILERLFVFTFIITNHWEGIGFLLAAKSVFRFGDLSKAEDRKLTEYILIGTLLSFGLAIFIGILYTQFK